jgi:acetylornithine/succinyldiaminopimelate/putrescine aminotransferase
MISKNRRINNNFSLTPTKYNQKRITNEPDCIRNTLNVVWHKANNFSVEDEDGNKWIDMTSGIFVTNAGHSNKEIIKAIKKQLDSKLLFSFLYDTKIRNDLTTKLLDISPKYFDKVLLASTGTEATDLAYKLIKYWGKNNNKKYIICFRGSYHGRALSCDFMSGTDNSSDWSNVKEDNVIFVDFPYSENIKFDSSFLPNKNEIAAFFLETYQGWGAWMYPEAFLKDLYAFAKENNILICFDEIQSGFYRMGNLYGYMSYGDYLQPDLICLGKGITSSLPLSAVLTRKELTDNGINMALGGTHSGNPVCCAAALANLEFLSNNKFQKKLKDKVYIFEQNCKELIKYKIVKNINFKGMVAGIIFDSTEVADNIIFECVKNGVLPVRTFRNAIKIAPPLTITKKALDEAFSVIKNSIEKFNNV